MISIRKALTEDSARLADLWHALHAEQQLLDPRFKLADDAAERWLNDLKEWLEAPDVRHVVVAESETELVAFASAQLWWPPPIYEQSLQVHIDEIYVEPAFRRMGIGTRLFEDIREWAHANSVEQIRLGTLAKNSDSIAFWSQIGAEGFVLEMLFEGPASMTGQQVPDADN
jgi:GNAT superfamily N-acetyltransferase